MDKNQVINLEALLKQVGLENLDEEQKTEFSTQFHKLVDLFFEKNILEILSDKDLEATKNLDNEAVVAYLKEHTDIDLDTLFVAAVGEAKESFLEDISYAQGVADAKLEGEA